MNFKLLISLHWNINVPTGSLKIRARNRAKEAFRTMIFFFVLTRILALRIFEVGESVYVVHYISKPKKRGGSIMPSRFFYFNK